MSVRSTKCKGCGKYEGRGAKFETIKEHNPETHDMNMNVTAKCICGHIDEYRTSSHYMQELRRTGRAI